MTHRFWCEMRNVCRRCPGIVPQMSRSCPGNVPEMSRRCSKHPTNKFILMFFFRFYCEICVMFKYHWGQNYYIPFFSFGGILFGNYYRKFYSMKFLGELFTVMTVAVLPLQKRIFRLQLQFFSLCFVGLSHCNITPFLYRILSFHNMICNNFVPSGTFCKTSIVFLLVYLRQFVCYAGVLHCCLFMFSPALERHLKNCSLEPPKC